MSAMLNPQERLPRTLRAAEADDKGGIVQSICDAIEAHDAHAIAAAVGRYPFEHSGSSARGISTLRAMQIFTRDGFIDRYSGKRLVNPAVLRVISRLLPKEFPFHNNWKMSDTHPAYWELAPTIDHIVPIARGGSNAEDNCITTCMLRNAAKANWTPDELGWVILPPGNEASWDGLTGWLIKYVETEGSKGLEPYVLKWYQAARSVTSVSMPAPYASPGYPQSPSACA
jgi:hypothetical protein